MKRTLVSTIIATFVVAVFGASVRAETWTFTDERGVPHFRAYNPKDGRPWKPVGGAPVDRRGWRKSGPRTSCKGDRRDVVLAKDFSRERFMRYDVYIKAAAAYYPSVPEALIRAVIYVESRYDWRVVSCAGAKGLMQIMPDEEPTYLIRNVFDPLQNIMAGTEMLQKYWWRYPGRIDLVAACHNAGLGAVMASGNRVPDRAVFIPALKKTLDYSSGGVVLYAQLVQKWYERFSRLGPEAPWVLEHQPPAGKRLAKK